MSIISQENLILGTLIRNIKYGNIETILGTCSMKLENDEWVDGVIYTGKDRLSGGNKIFVKQTKDFIKEFELLCL